MDGSDRITALMADMDAHSRADFDDDVALFMKYRKMTPKGIMQLCESQQEEIKIKRDAISRLTAENAAMRKALEPFAGIETGVSGADDDLWYIYDGDQLTVGDFRRARAALQHQGSSTKSEE